MLFPSRRSWRAREELHLATVGIEREHGAVLRLGLEPRRRIAPGVLTYGEYILLHEARQSTVPIATMGRTASFRFCLSSRLIKTPQYFQTSTSSTARVTPPATPPTIAAIGTDAELPPEEGFDVGVEDLLVTVRVTTSTRAGGVALNGGGGDMGSTRGKRKGERDETERKGRKGGASLGEEGAKVARTRNRWRRLQLHSCRRLAKCAM